jgi:hypothetical protein
MINNFISNSPSITQPTSRLINAIMDEPNQENPLEELFSELIPTASSPKSTTIKIDPDKTLNINPNLNTTKIEHLMQLLHE